MNTKTETVSKNTQPFPQLPPCAIEGLPFVLQRPSPNFDTPRTHPIRFIILHGTWLESDRDALDLYLCNPECGPDAKGRVSSHYFIDQQGQLHQLVADEHIAWHAGASQWGEVEGLNAHSIGIEISNPGEKSGVPYHECQYITLCKLLKHLQQKHGILSENVLAHSDIAPGRKFDPGNHFNWNYLEKESLACVERKP